jgi:hypothetical protein
VARRRKRRRKSSYEDVTSETAEGSSAVLVAEELSPRARRLVDGGVIDLNAIAGSGESGEITSGDILHAARLMEVEQSVARIEVAHTASDVGSSDIEIEINHPEVAVADDAPDPVSVESGPQDLGPELAAVPSEGTPLETTPREDTGESSTSTAVAIGGQPIAVEPTPWNDYDGTTEGLAASALPGANRSWGEARAHLAAMADEAAARQPREVVPSPEVSQEHEPDDVPAVPIAEVPFAEVPSMVTRVPEPVRVPEAVVLEPFAEEPVPVALAELIGSGEIEPVAIETVVTAEPAPHREVMMDFGTLELVDPESVWEEGAEDFAPWFLAHSQQLGDVLGLEKGLNDARQFTTKSATGVLGTDDNGEDVVVVSSRNATADDSDLGRALGMAASSGASSVALVTAALHEDQLKALAWLNNQTRSGVRWYGIEMRVVRIADSPAAMLFDLVASPPQEP